MQERNGWEEVVYPAKIWQDSAGRFVVEFKDIHWAATDGANMAEALAEGEDCLGTAIGHLMKLKAEVPRPSPCEPEDVAVSVPLYLAPKLALYTAMREKGISNVELGRRLGVTEAIARRLVDPKHDSKPEKIQAALAAVGTRIRVSIATGPESKDAEAA